MNSFIELLRRRRSVRRYSSRKIEQEKVDILVEAMLRSPSSRSLNPWEFVIVTEKDRLERLAKAKPHGGAFLQGAPLAIVVCADPEQCDVWIEDCSIAAILLHLQATDLGLGSCWVQIRLRDNMEGGSAENYVKKELDLPSSHAVEAIIGIGYPEEEKKGHSYPNLLKERVHYNGYSID